MDDEAPLTDAERATRMAQGRDAFNQGDYYEAHELWESVWNVVDAPLRTWVQGLIQVATAFHKLQNGRDDVCAILLRKALPKLKDAPPVIEGVQAAIAREAAKSFLAAIDRGESPDPRAVKL